MIPKLKLPFIRVNFLASQKCAIMLQTNCYTCIIDSYK